LKRRPCAKSSFRNFRRFRRPIRFRPPTLNTEQDSGGASAALRRGGTQIRGQPARRRDRIGKTETYFEAVAEALRQDKQTLILLPRSR